MVLYLSISLTKLIISFFLRYSNNRDQPVLTHLVPTRRSSNLPMQPFHRRRFPPPAKRGRDRWRRPASVLPLVAGAELGGRLIGEVALAEAVRRHQGEVLRRADELLQLRIEGVEELLVLLPEGKAAVALHRL